MVEQVKFLARGKEEEHTPGGNVVERTSEFRFVLGDFGKSLWKQCFAFKWMLSRSGNCSITGYSNKCHPEGQTGARLKLAL